MHLFKCEQYRFQNEILLMGIYRNERNKYVNDEMRLEIERRKMVYTNEILVFFLRFVLFHMHAWILHLLTLFV